MVVPVTTSTLRRWENPEDMDLDEVSVYQRALLIKQHHHTKYNLYKNWEFEYNKRAQDCSVDLLELSSRFFFLALLKLTLN